MRTLFTNLLFVAFSLYSYGQAQTVKGVVKGESGETLPGVNIVVKGTMKGVITGLNGDYAIKVNDVSKDVLTFSFIGFETIEVPVKGKLNMDVVLRTTFNELEEVVAVGYGTVRKKDLTGSVASANVQELAKVPVTNVAEALAGRVAGVQIRSSEGKPGAEVKIRVRGGGSITQSNEPLYVIDGVATEDGLNLLDPSEIESIDVLKDASSTAIYGARGANGVILITTRGGKVGKTRISYDAYYGIRKISNFLDVLDAEGFVRLDYERTVVRSAEELAAWINLYGPYADVATNYANLPEINWQKEIFGGAAANQFHKIGISGGTDVTKYNLTYSFTNDEGVMINSGMSRNNASFNFDHKVSKKFDANAVIRYSEQEVFGTGTSTESTGRFNKLSQLINYRNTAGLSGNIGDVLNSDTDDYQDDIAGSVLVNPVVAAMGEYKKAITRALSMNTRLTYKINNHFKYTFSGGIKRNDIRNETAYGSKTREALSGGGAKGSLNHTENQGYNYSNVLDFNYKKDKHTIGAMLGQEEVYNMVRSFTASANKFPSDDIVLDNLGLGAEAVSPSSNKIDDRIISGFGRVNYTYADKYLFTGTMRADGSTKFGSGNKFGYFPSASVAWRLGEEEFVKKMNAFSNLKLRFSYGVSGNNRIPNFKSLAVMGADFYGLGNANVNIFAPSNIANPDLKWETTYARNLGVDMGFLKQRIQFTTEFYLSNTKDLLLDAKLPLISGFPSMIQNIGETQNKGFEVTLNTENISTKNFHWTTSFNISVNKNKVVALASGADFFLTSSGVSGIDDYIVQVGEPVGVMYGFLTDGLYRVDDFDYNSTNQTYTIKTGIPFNANAKPQPGYMKVRDISGPDGVPDGTVNTTYDRTIIGNANPKHFGGITNTFTYKGFDLSIFMNWSYGNDVFNATKMANTTTETQRFNALGVVRDRWMTVDQAGTVVKDPVLLADLNKNATWYHWNGAGERNARVYDIFIEDGSYLRISNINLGYSLPSDLCKKLKIAKMRVYTTVNNIYTFSSYTGYDPDANTRDNGGITAGVDWCAYPRSKQIVFGLNLSL